MGPFPKLFTACLNREVTKQSDDNGWRAATQVGFRQYHRLEDMVLAVDYAIDRAKAKRRALALAFLDLEKAFDRVPREKLITVLLDYYGLNPSIVETIRRMYLTVKGQVNGDTASFNMSMGVKQGCPMSPQLFGLFFDRVVEYVETHLPAAALLSSTEGYFIAHLLI